MNKIGQIMRTLVVEVCQNLLRPRDATLDALFVLGGLAVRILGQRVNKTMNKIGGNLWIESIKLLIKLERL